MIVKFPVEIIANIFKYMSIAECRTVIEAYLPRYSRWGRENYGIVTHTKNLEYKEMLQQVYNDRIALDLYLAEYFPNPKGLLDCMMKTDTIISGSRALNFFISESVDSNSDWDFYTVNNVSVIVEFMEYMKNSGVRWQSTAESLQDKIESNKEICVVTVDELSFLNKEGKCLSVDSYIKENVKDLFDQYNRAAQSVMNNSLNWEHILQSKIYKASKRDGSEQNVQILSNEYSNKSKLSIITGVLHYRDKSTKLQLMISTKKHPLEPLLDFHMSIVQCAITGFNAIHMYASDAYNREATLWTTTYSDTPQGSERITNSVNKYKNRGFKFYTKSLDSLHNKSFGKKATKRSIGDSNTDIINYSAISPHEIMRVDHNGELDYKSETSINDMSIKQQDFFDFTWLEYDNRLEENHYIQYQNDNKRSKLYDKYNNLHGIVNVGAIWTIFINSMRDAFGKYNNRKKSDSVANLTPDARDMYLSMQPLSTIVHLRSTT